jgi:peptidoglycan/xylan/chitin deacetylase (PgdA/CDA1 family)
MVTMLFLIAATVVLGYLICYGGLRGPVDWIMRTRAHRGPRAQPRVALTFDDGPDPAHTPALLDALAELDVKATFFLVGHAVDAHPALSRRIAAEGHEIGNHTYRHPYLPLVRSSDVARELQAAERAIADTTGVVPRLARPPWGARAPWTVRVFRRRALRMVLWDVNSFDWRGAPAQAVAQRVLERARGGSIVLMHEARPGGDVTVEAVRLLVPALRARGLEPARVSEVLAA